MGEIADTIESVRKIVGDIVESWNEREKNYDEALRGIMLAVFTTRNYIREIERKGENSDRERELVNLWMDAGTKLRPINKDLAKDCQIKALY